jgi:hypothetical protein
VIDQRNEDPPDFNKQDVGDRLQIVNSGVEVGLTVGGIQRFGIRVEMFQKEKAERYNAR